MTARALRQPHAALMDLCDGFFDTLDFLSSCPRLAPEELPPTARGLLVHREHMTAVLHHHYGRPVDVRVLRDERGAEHYARKVLLTLSGSDRVVELGIVRMDFRYISAEVRDEILARRAPLGDILIRHNVLRRISPRWYFLFPRDTPIGRAFDSPGAPGSAGRPVYGRVGTIYCDEEPAIDLLEVVSAE